MEKLSIIPERTTRRVLELNHQGALRSRLLALGLRPGARVEVLQRVTWGDPMLVKVGNATLSLRHQVAEQILVGA